MAKQSKSVIQVSFRCSCWSLGFAYSQWSNTALFLLYSITVNCWVIWDIFYQILT